MITTQVIDTARGCPAAGVPVDLDFFITGHGWRLLGQALTNHDGMVESFGERPAEGIYRLSFDIAAYRSETDTAEADTKGAEADSESDSVTDAFFPSISITFAVRDAGASHHIPLFLSPYGYSTYRA
jgi:5-hydroxyisourate hydrolase